MSTAAHSASLCNAWIVRQLGSARSSCSLIGRLFRKESTVVKEVADNITALNRHRFLIPSDFATPKTALTVGFKHPPQPQLFIADIGTDRTWITAAVEVSAIDHFLFWHLFPQVGQPRWTDLAQKNFKAVAKSSQTQHNKFLLVSKAWRPALNRSVFFRLRY